MESKKKNSILSPGARDAYERLMCIYTEGFESTATVEIEVPSDQTEMDRLASELAANKGYDFTLRIVTNSPMKEGNA